MRSRVSAVARAAAVALLVAALFAGCKEKAEKPPPRVSPVVVANAVGMTVPVQLSSIGKVEAYSTVSVRSQVDGQLLEVNFREGQDVKKGEVLFQIDPRPFKAALAEAEAALARDRAQAETARVNARRYELMVEKDYVSREQFDQVRVNADALDATVKADEALVQSRRLDLEYTTIRSPMDGRVGSLLVHAGNVVKSNDAVLVTINQINPIYVSFSVPEQNLAEVQKYMATGSLPVEAVVPGPGQVTEKGVLTFVNNTVDVSTGTILLKGTFRNPRRNLWPGQFVNVVLTLASRPGATVVPSQALQQGQEGLYLYVVKPDMTVEPRQVETGASYEGKTVIDRGVAPGETVVTDGQLGLVPGSRVSIKGSLKEAK
jgi:multidrug efflux system membrane fusion protein